MDSAYAFIVYCYKICLLHIVTRGVTMTSAEITMTTSSKRSVFDDKVKSERLLWKHNTRGPGLCVGSCNRNMECSSIFYNKVSGQCQGHSLTFGLAVDVTMEDGWRYYILPRGERYIGDACSGDADCVTVNSECRNQRCLCVPGYSFSPRSRDCLPACTGYGKDFLEVRDHFLNGLNVETVENMTLEGCFELCRGAVGYTCRSLEYGRTTTKCYLTNTTKLQNAGNWFEDAIVEYNISYYQRDCD